MPFEVCLPHDELGQGKQGSFLRAWKYICEMTRAVLTPDSSVGWMLYIR
jgi:hypothetical protein